MVSIYEMVLDTPICEVWFKDKTQSKGFDGEPSAPNGGHYFWHRDIIFVVCGSHGKVDGLRPGVRGACLCGTSE